MKVTTYNNRPITQDTATIDIVNLYAELNQITVQFQHIRRLCGIYVWELEVDNMPCFTAGIAATRRHCLDGTLESWVKDATP